MAGDLYKLRPCITPYSWMATTERATPFSDYEHAQWAQDPDKVKDWEIVGRNIPNQRTYAHELRTSYMLETARFSTTTFTSGCFSTSYISTGIRTDR